MRRKISLFLTIALTSAYMAGNVHADNRWQDVTFGEWKESHELTVKVTGLPDDASMFYPAEPEDLITGNSIFIGEWDTGNNLDGQADPVEWVILAVEDGKALVLSREPLECIPFNREYHDTVWEDSELRTWLNGPFIEEAFTEEERESILLTTVPNDDSQGNYAFETPAGEDTEDYLFALSYKETETYLGTDIDLLVAKANPHVAEQGAHVSEVDDWAGCVRWWLRSPGPDQRSACIVHESGGYGGILHYHSIRFDEVCVRPAFWLDLSSESICVCPFDFLIG